MMMLLFCVKSLFKVNLSFSFYCPTNMNVFYLHRLVLMHPSHEIIQRCVHIWLILDDGMD